MSNPILYSYFRSSASFRVRIALYLKEVPFEYRPIHLLKNGGEQHSKGYLHLNPIGQVPSFVHNNQTLGQSMAIINYIDQQWSAPPFFPKDPWRHAQIIEVCELINSGIQPLQNLGVTQRLKSQLQASDQDVKKWNHFWISKGLEAIENRIEPTADHFSFGKTVTAADLFIIPQVFSSTRFGVDMNKYPCLSRVNKNCMELEAFQQAAPNFQPDAPKDNQ